MGEQKSKPESDNNYSRKSESPDLSNLPASLRNASLSPKEVQERAQIANETIMRAIARSRAEPSMRPPRPAIIDIPADEMQKKFARRKALLHKQDPKAYERVLGTRNIQSIAYLHAGLRAARSVCRIKTLDPEGGTPAYGTGFLIAPCLLLTNHHVLRSIDEANRSLAEFDYELDMNFVEKRGRIVSLVASELFFTDAELDITLVAIVPIAHDNTPVNQFGFLPLLPRTGKIMTGENVSIIQHAEGGTKQVVLRENRILPEDGDPLTGGEFDSEGNLLQYPKFIRYEADTEPGSSGSPVFNDQWDVVAIHHASLPKFDANNNILSLEQDENGEPKRWSPDMGEDKIYWIANEGVRVSAIMLRLQEAAATDESAMRALRRMVGTTSARMDAASIKPDEALVPDGPAFESTRYASREFRQSAGYRAEFLGPNHRVEMPTPSPELKKFVALTKDRKPRLDYTHFSIVMHAERKLALYTAVNIDGARRVESRRKSVRWRKDPRLADEFQTLAAVYGPTNRNGVQLDRGHLVRRLDPVWGDPADETFIAQAEDDTFHYTNASPQEHGFNDQTWGNLEDWILARAEGLTGDKQKIKMCVFTGPVLRPDDREFGAGRPGGPWKIPHTYWKVVAFRTRSSALSVSAYKLEQTHAIDPLFERYSPYTDAQTRTFQIPVTMVEDLTGLKFGDLVKSDRFGKSVTESTARRQQPLRNQSDIVL